MPDYWLSADEQLVIDGVRVTVLAVDGGEVQLEIEYPGGSQSGGGQSYGRHSGSARHGRPAAHRQFVGASALD